MSNKGVPPSLIEVELVFSSETNATKQWPHRETKEFIVTKKVQ